jgi:integrase
MPTIELVEKSFADAMVAITNSPDLKQTEKTHWVCALRQIAKWFDRPIESVPARLTAIRIRLGQLHHQRLGVTAKTVANHKSSCRAALRWFCQSEGVPARGAPLTPAWARLKNCIPDKGPRVRLYALMRFCSAKGVEPAMVDDALIDRFMCYRRETTALASNDMAKRSVARAWNACVDGVAGWPPRRLMEPPLRGTEGPAWEDFPEGLRNDIDTYLATFEKLRRGRQGKRIRPNKPSSLRTRRAELVAFACKAVRSGIPIDSLTDLSRLLHPDVVEQVIEAYCADDDEDPPVYVIDLSWKLLRMASATGCVGETGLQRLDDIRASLEEYRRTGLTPKNKALIRQILADEVWSELVNLPRILMAQARAALYHAPVKAAVTAQLAVAIAILIHAPIRLQNLVSILLDTHLTKPGGFEAPYFLHFDPAEVKNRVDLDVPFDEHLTALIDGYVHDFRPILMRGSNASWLFPGEDGGKKTKTTLSSQITERIAKATGLRITVHQFRHAVAARYLKSHPGDYETVSRLLCHKSRQTTINCYCGLETIQASELWAKVVRKDAMLEVLGADDD